MKYRWIPRTELRLSEIGFGVWTVSTGWWGRMEEAQAVYLLQRAFDGGINFFDTADTYGLGYGEEVLAKALKKDRSQVVIGTKFGYDFYTYPHREGHQERPQNFDPAFVRYACEQSLRRLKTDYIDLYQLHNPRLEAIRRDDLFDLLEALVREGKIRYYGVALGPDIGWQEEGEAAMRERKVVALQIIYNILEQDPARSFFPVAQQEQVGLLVRVPHASEVLTGRFTQVPHFDPSDHRSHRRQQWLEEALRKVKKLEFLTQGKDMTLGQAALKFCLAQPTVASVLPNITSLAELEEYLQAPELPDLPEEDLFRLKELYERNFELEEVNRK